MPDEDRRLKICWPNEHGVSFKGRGIIEAWGKAMERHGWAIVWEPSRWKECDLVFFGSDSQAFVDPIGSKPTVLYFWGWEPARLLDKEFKRIAAHNLEYFAQITRILCPGLVTMYQVADFGLSSTLCIPGVDSEVLDMGDESIEKENQVIFLSRLVQHKHPEVVIQASYLSKTKPKVVIVGPGDSTPLKELAEDLKVDVEFKELEDKDKANELRRSKLLAHPSEYEGFGLPPFEALYCGTPVSVFDIPQSRWALQEDALYFSTVEGLAHQMDLVESNPEFVSAITSHGKERVRKQLSLDEACDRLWAQLHQVIKEFLAVELRMDPSKWQEVYDKEHRRNWAYGQEDVAGYNGPARFDPTWVRHWRAQEFIKALRDCGAKLILDVGCGPVYPTIMAQAGFEVEAIDISPECIRQVEEVAKKWAVDSKVVARVADATDLKDYPDNFFSGVIHGEIWEHIPELDKVISESIRVLRPGGHLVVSTPIGGHHYDPMHVRDFDDKSIHEVVDKLLDRVEVKDFRAIAEGDLEPSCYFIVMEKKNG